MQFKKLLLKIFLPDDESWLLGHSVGGAVVNMFAAQYPEQVAGIINVEGNFTKTSYCCGKIALERYAPQLFWKSIVSKVTLIGHIIVPEAEIASVKVALVAHIELTRQEDGCIVFNVTQDAASANRFDVYEEFTDKESFVKHQERVRNSEWGVITVNVERHYEITGMD
ncbi:MAG: alpha/beta fold hydrolase [Granulosicoccaceae bacterium]